MRIIKVISCAYCPNNSDETYCEYAAMEGLSDNPNCPIAYKEPDNDMLINNIELADALAEPDTIKQMLERKLITKEEEAFVDLGDGETAYTEEAQDIFDKYYDYYRDIIDKCNQLT